MIDTLSYLDIFALILHYFTKYHPLNALLSVTGTFLINLILTISTPVHPQHPEKDHLGKANTYPNKKDALNYPYRDGKWDGTIEHV